MNVFVAGATGALGVPVVRALVAAGHDVTGTTRVESRRPQLESLGARAVIMDALDSRSVQEAISAAEPNAIVEILTALPKKGPLRVSDLTATNKLRVTGTANILEAAQSAGVKRIVGESLAFFYGFGDNGDRIFIERDPIPRVAPQRALQPALDALIEHERLLEDAGGIVLRFGIFYGPEAGSSAYIARMLRRRMMPLISGGRGVHPWIHLHDAATASVAALGRGEPGEIYNVVDDEPVSVRDAFAAFAEAARAPLPWSVPKPLAAVWAPYAADFLTWVVRASNQKAKDELGWRPRYPNVRAGAQSLQ